MFAANGYDGARDAERLEWTRRTADAMSEVLAAAREQMFDRPAGSALIRMATLAGRVDFRHAVEALLPWEAAVIGEALTAEPLRLRPLDSPVEDDDCEPVLVAQASRGRLLLYSPGEEPDPDATPCARLELPPPASERASEVAAEAELVESVERRPFEQLLAEWASQGQLGDVVRDVADRVDHVESIYVYVGRRLFARSDVGNTLLRGGELLALAERPLHDWPVEERLFVVAFHLLFTTGRSIRMEEFNGRQLTARSVRDWLEQRHALYCSQLGITEERPDGLIELAQRVGSLRGELEPGDVIGFRRINGLTMAKREHLGRFPRLEPDSLGPVLRPLAEKNGASGDGDPAEAIRSLAATALAQKVADPDSRMVERLLERIVLSAVCEAGADYGMSSSIRDLWRLEPEADNRCAGVLGLVKKDFFCVSVPHPSLVSRLDEEAMSEVLQAVASRMQFNRWHFIAGNFERHEIPAKRHFFFPPLMPDIAEWSDLRHPGHTNSSVRYTVRAPGPALWRPPLRVFGNEYRGFLDIRLVRMNGPPFTLREVQVACRHCALVEAFWSEAARMTEDGLAPSPTVSGFTPEYWNEMHWVEAVREAAALEGDAEEIIDQSTAGSAAG
jgi:hypothetical protein